MAEIDGNSSEGVFALRWGLRLVAFILVYYAVAALSSHPSVAYGQHGAQTAQCPTVVSALRGIGPPHTKSGAAVPAAKAQCASIASSDIRSSAVLLGVAVALAGISFIPWPDRKQPAPGWVQFEGKWYPPHFESRLPTRTSQSGHSRGPNFPQL
jgi:hypothetical protein